MLPYDQLAALASVVRTGSFERAAERLHVTPSAVSQRLKLLEERLGAVLVIRGQPCTATAAGARLCRHAEEVALLERTLEAELGAALAGQHSATLRIAVNADSLATWFVDAMAQVEDLLFDLVLDDQDHSADWLRRGEVSAAVSAQGGAIQGCSSRPLGALRYVATASPSFAARWFSKGVDEAALAKAPCLQFNTKDALQRQWVTRLLGHSLDMPCHWLPATHAFIEAALADLGWGLNPLSLVATHLHSGALVELVPKTALDIPLYWQTTRALETAIEDVSAAVRSAAGRHLVQPGRPGPRGPQF
ncbi:LysR family transcriptional regulator ArgP [Afifella sp. JA880]|uniref:LysR family transcriptional regulator ArgP n=1 Tax=Afifella sp. JA880 TaxID=2975280 RepID=UPI0021BAAA01|nr:LysR family transcriptional regulator ArgP [Afifella sp. JA880]MCT8267551.1 LysR family transcriptional regulator ArgP [Afifella sp. JA880]